MSVGTPARRFGPRGWRDPRVLVGISLMVVSVVAGALLLSSYDRSVSVWALRRDLPAGARVSADDLTAVRVGFGDPALRGRYLRSTDELPDDARLAHALTRGDLLPRSALTRGGPTSLVEVPLSVRADEVPTTVRPGSVVDVWAIPGDDERGAGDRGGTTARASRVLDDVTVVRLSGRSGSLAPATTAQVVVAVPGRDPARLALALGQVGGEDLLVTRQR